MALPPPPRFPPAYFDPALGLDVPVVEARRTVLTLFHALPDLAPRWHRGGAATGLARQGDTLLVAGLRLALVPHRSGWLGLAVSGRLDLMLWMERPYEDWDLYPPDAPCRRAEAPGRLTGALDRVELAAEAWPALAPFAENGWLILQA